MNRVLWRTILLSLIPSVAFAHGEQTLLLPATDIFFVLTILVLISLLKSNTFNRRAARFALLPAIIVAWLLTPQDYLDYLNHPLVVLAVHYFIALGAWLPLFLIIRRFVKNP
jgi:hypothetical protein